MSTVFSCYNRCGSRISRRGCQLTEKVSPLQELPQNKVMYKTFSASAQPKGTPYWICPLGMVDELTLCIIKSKLVTEMTRSCNQVIHRTTYKSEVIRRRGVRAKLGFVGRRRLRNIALSKSHISAPPYRLIIIAQFLKG